MRPATVLAATFPHATKRHRNMIICLKLQFIISFSRLRHGQSHPVHGYRIKPGFSFDVSDFYNQPDGLFQTAIINCLVFQAALHMTA
jgi:hypothetical protein